MHTGRGESEAEAGSRYGTRKEPQAGQIKEQKVAIREPESQKRKKKKKNLERKKKKSDTKWNIFSCPSTETDNGQLWLRKKK